MKHFLLLSFLLVTAASRNCFAQTKNKKPVNAGTEILTNASIISLNDAGLGDDVIISKIENAQTNFDLSSGGLIALKGHKVDNDIIKAMLNKGSAAKSGLKVTNPAPQPSNRLPSIELIGQVYGLNVATNTVSPLEKGVANLKTKMKLMGYGGASVIYTVEAAKSPFRISGSDSACFVINTSGPAPELTLYKLTVVKQSRQATTQKIKGGFSGEMTGGDNVIAFTVISPQSGIYKLTPAIKLTPGEYFFATKPVTSATTIDVYAFGID